MAQTEAEVIKDGGSVSIDESEEDSLSEAGDVINSSNRILSKNGFEHAEEEFHTEESDMSDSEDDGENASDLDELSDGNDLKPAVPTTDTPLLPAELLKPLPSPTFSLFDGVTIPWNQMTRDQKRAERLRSRRAAKREWDAMQRGMSGTKDAAKQSGALDAGRMAQLRRTKSEPVAKVRSGRVKKETKRQMSGRDRLLQARKKSVERESQALKTSKRKKKALPKR